MKRFHIVGRKSHGKTTLVVQLVRALAGRGLRVGTIKHTGHLHETDAPGTDSHQHRCAGAAPAAIVTADLIGIHLPRRQGMSYSDVLAPMFAGCDLVLVEGDLEGDGHKLEVWRESLGTPCLALTHPDIQAVISDDDPAVHVPVFSRSDLSGLLHYLETVGHLGKLCASREGR